MPFAYWHRSNFPDCCSCVCWTWVNTRVRNVASMPHASIRCSNSTLSRVCQSLLCARGVKRRWHATARLGPPERSGRRGGTGSHAAIRFRASGSAPPGEGEPGRPPFSRRAPPHVRSSPSLFPSTRPVPPF